jgi:hypothetical protein
MYSPAEACYETASPGSSMYSDLPVPESTGCSRMKVRTPRGQVQPLKVPCLPGGPSMPCCADLRPTTSSLHKHSGLWTHRSTVCARTQCARRAAAQVALDTGTSAHAHTPGSRESPPSRELPPPPASLPPPEWLLMENLPTVPTDPVPFFTLVKIFTHRNRWGGLWGSHDQYLSDLWATGHAVLCE